jgi:HEAT repeat protein
MHGREDKDKEMAELRKELRDTRQLAVLSMFQSQSASERLQGVSYSTRSDRPDPEVLAALMHTLRYDSSVDVRLAALDALRRYNTQPAVRDGMVESLAKQNSPMVQIALIDQLVEMKERKAADSIKRLEQDPKLNPAVRERARWGLRQLQG